MKLRNLFLAAIVALGMVACNNEDVPQVTNGAESTVSIKIMPSSNGSATKAVGNLSGDLTAESAIKQVEVYLYFGDVLQVYKDTTNATNISEVTGIATTTGPKSIVVVANAGLGSVASKTALLAKTENLPVTIANGLPMTGMTTTDIIVVPGHNQYGYTSSNTGNQIEAGNPLKITRVNARVAIVGASLGELPVEQSAIFNSLRSVEVAIFNVPKASNLFGNSLAINNDFLFGEAWPSALGSYAVGTAEASFKDSPVAFPIVNTAAPYYYVNENTATDKKEQMLIVLRGKPYLGENAVKEEGLYTDENGFTYYPVWVNSSDEGYTYGNSHTADSKVLRNTQYNITLTINGIGNPTIDPVQDAWLDVQVAVEDWTVVNQNVTWN